MQTTNFRLGAALCIGCALAATTFAVRAQSEPVRTLPTSMLIGFERLRLPGGEAMGLVGAQYLFEPWRGWRVGPAVYGAATGQRGGLFTWGGEVQYLGRPSPAWQWSAGLYAGGGGGAAAPVGGGLMLRPHLDLWWRQPGWQLGVSASEVRFPSGQISSRQLGLMLGFDDSFTYTAPAIAGQRLDWTGRAGVGFERVQALVGQYRFQQGSGGSMGHVGVRLDRTLGSPGPGGARAVAGLEAAGAAHGGTDGYAEGLGTLGVELPLGAASLGVRGALGLAGGGAVPTRGGGIAKLALNATLPVGGGWFVAGELGRMRALQGPLRADYAQLGVGFLLDQPTAAPSAGSTVQVTRWGLALASYGEAQRKASPARGMQTIGLRFDRLLGEHLYLSGQAHSAIYGGAGAYSVGLVGLGAGVPLAPGWRAGGEFLVGAAGGGGVAVQGGAVMQPMAWVARELGPYSRVQLGAGRLRALRGDLTTPVLELDWVVAFGLPERR